MEDTKGTSDIQDYFNEKTVLITGSTGFVGKLLVEKILRTCNVKKVFITMRPKKNKTIYQRLEEYFDSVLFDRLKSERRNAIKKLEMIGADLSLPDLGITISDRKLLTEEVNLVFHTAATVRFDETLRIAAYINVRGTSEILKLCSEMKNLQSVVYVSTAYSFCVKKDVEEKFYKPPLKSEELLTVVDTFNDQTLQTITPQIIGDWPNTYVYTKSIAEDIVNSYWNTLPIAMIRPSIIVATDRDPVPGWIDNYIGATGVFVGASIGLIRTLHCRSNYVADIVPVDFVVNSIIAAASRVSKHRSNPEEKKQIYHCATSFQNPLTWDDCMNTGAKHAADFATVFAVWRYLFLPCSNRFLYLFLHYTLHIVPAYIVDFCSLCIGRKPQLVKGYQKISKLLDVLAYFSTRQWIFPNHNTQQLWNSLNEYDQACYNFDVKALNWNSYFYNFARGGRIYLLKDPLETMPQGLKKQFRLKVAHYVILFFLALLCLQFIKYVLVLIF